MLRISRHAARSREARRLPAGAVPGPSSGAGWLISVVRPNVGSVSIRLPLLAVAVLALGGCIGFVSESASLRVSVRHEQDTSGVPNGVEVVLRQGARIWREGTFDGVARFGWLLPGEYVVEVPNLVDPRAISVRAKESREIELTFGGIVDIWPGTNLGPDRSVDGWAFTDNFWRSQPVKR